MKGLKSAEELAYRAIELLEVTDSILRDFFLD